VGHAGAVFGFLALKISLFAAAVTFVVWLAVDGCHGAGRIL
jgi:hypothetical protein